MNTNDLQQICFCYPFVKAAFIDKDWRLMKVIEQQ